MTHPTEPVSAASTSDVDTIRRAAALMRERAKAATPGPWSAADEHGLLGPDASPAWCVSNMRPGFESMPPTEGYLGTVAETSLGFHEPRDQHNAEHNASWHPAVALAVAEVLAFAVETWSDDRCNSSRGWDETCGECVNCERHWAQVRALAAARAYLGEQS